MRKSKIIMISGALLLLALFVFPLWNITLMAPQYPDSIGMNIWINKIADKNPNDIKNINLMNHYVGMKAIPEQMKEFEIFPPVIIIMTLLGVVVGIIGNKNLYLTWFIVMIILGAIGLYDFYLWEYDYGHDLDPKAAIKIPGQGYQPPLIGYKQILNFTAISLPLTGAYFLFCGISMALVAFFVGKKEQEREEKI
ncbi:MAG: hypothetical protein OEY51_13945 [Cyclobacteriaceae bacterium]|nr:hypothetical protein [Cyclobacteriaceae bacterium]